jgi:spectinomycin phosphotransferase
LVPRWPILRRLIGYEYLAGVQEPPRDLSDSKLAELIVREYGVEAASIDYEPVGYGAHHWKVVAVDGTRYFVTLDDLHAKSWFGPRVEDTFAGLATAYAVARSLFGMGLEFVVAPEVSAAGEVVIRLGESHGLSMTAYLDGLTLGFGAKPGLRELSELQRVLAEVHQATPPAGIRIERLSDVVTEVRDGLRIRQGHVVGPYSARLFEWLQAMDSELQEAVVRLASYAATAAPDHLVVTHGEPHWGNLIVTSQGLRLVDWDTVALGHAERDLWHISRDPSDLVEYAKDITVPPRRELLEFYALAWTLRDVVAYVQYYTRPHDDDTESAIAWDNLMSLSLA